MKKILRDERDLEVYTLYQNKIKVWPLHAFLTKVSKSSVEADITSKTPVALITGCGEIELGTSNVPWHERIDERIK